MTTILATCVAGLLVVAAALVRLPTAQSPGASRVNAAADAPVVTLNTVRLTGPNVYAQAVAVTQTIYGATHHEDRPHAVSLVRADRQADAMLAASRITHFPVNAPVLYVDADRLPPETFEELKRLGPDGATYDRKVQVYLVGPIAESVEGEVRERLGYKTRAFRMDDPFELSEALDTWAAAVHGDHPDEVAIVQFDQLATGLPVTAWNAHMGHALMYVRGREIPEPTRRALTRRFEREAYIYLMGDETVIPRSVEEELTAYGHVQRVPAPDAPALSVAFAGFRDAGLNQGYWIGSWTRDFGWGIAEAGHNFTFVNPDEWQVAVTGSLLSHMGKHGPMLLIRPDGPSPELVRYLELVRPAWSAPADQLANHGWVLGSLAATPRAVQFELDRLLGPE